jgi:hypothetical protein
MSHSKGGRRPISRPRAWPQILKSGSASARVTRSVIARASIR